MHSKQPITVTLDKALQKIVIGARVLLKLFLNESDSQIAETFLADIVVSGYNIPDIHIAYH